MAERRAIELAHLLAGAFAFGVVTFPQSDRDQAVLMTGHHMRCRRGCRQEIECQAMSRILRAGAQRQAQAHQGVEQPALGGLQGLPGRQVLGKIQVRHDVVVPAGGAKRRFGVCGHQPVAANQVGVGAEAVGRRTAGSRLTPIVTFMRHGQ